MTDLDRLLELARKAQANRSFEHNIPQGPDYEYLPCVGVTPDTIIGLIERVKEAEKREAEAIHREVTQGVVWRETVATLEARLRAAEEVVERAKDAGEDYANTNGPILAGMERLNDALRHYDEAVKP